MFGTAIRSLQLTSRRGTKDILASTPRFTPPNVTRPCFSQLQPRSTRPFTSCDTRWASQERFGPTNFAGPVGAPETPESIWKYRDASIVKNLQPPPTPYSGRSVPVINNELSVAFGRLKRILDRNNVQRELRLTERHEKKGYKRRRLASERWRRRFAHEVRKKVQLVNEIRARGA